MVDHQCSFCFLLVTLQCNQGRAKSGEQDKLQSFSFCFSFLFYENRQTLEKEDGYEPQLPPLPYIPFLKDPVFPSRGSSSPVREKKFFRKVISRSSTSFTCRLLSFGQIQLQVPKECAASMLVLECQNCLRRLPSAYFPQFFSCTFAPCKIRLKCKIQQYNC